MTTRIKGLYVCSLSLIAAGVLVVTATKAFGSTSTGKSTCVIEFMDGKKMTLSLDLQGTRASQNVARIMDSNKWVMEIDGKTVIIPMDSIRTVEITPAVDLRPYPFVRGTLIKGQ